jgi:mRNA interferase HigB
MHVIAYSKIATFIQHHPNSESSLNSWFKLISKTNFSNFNELKLTFPNADTVKDNKGNSLVVFNIHGNNVRLIAAIHYNRNKVFIREILTHAEYDKNKWKK